MRHRGARASRAVDEHGPHEGGVRQRLPQGVRMEPAAHWAAKSVRLLCVHSCLHCKRVCSADWTAPSSLQTCRSFGTRAPAGIRHVLRRSAARASKSWRRRSRRTLGASSRGWRRRRPTLRCRRGCGAPAATRACTITFCTSSSSAPHGADAGANEAIVDLSASASPRLPAFSTSDCPRFHPIGIPRCTHSAFLHSCCPR